jgi:hypothetical protein
MKQMILIILILTIWIQNSFAGCQACWELKFVEITTKNSDTIRGYVKWNRTWYVNFENYDIKIPDSFPEDFMNYYSKWDNGQSIIELYKEIFKIGTTEEWSGFVSTKDNFVEINFSEIKNVKKINNHIDNISGATIFQILTLNELEILNNKPFHTNSFHDGCIYYYLNYNQDLDESEFNELVNKSLTEEMQTLKSNRILRIIKCYD